MKKKISIFAAIIILLSGLSGIFGTTSAAISMGNNYYEDSFTEAYKWNCFDHVSVNEDSGKLVLQSGTSKSGYGSHNGFISAPYDIYKVQVECTGHQQGSICLTEVIITVDGGTNQKTVISFSGQGSYSKTGTWDVPASSQGKQLGIAITMSASICLITNMDWIKVTYWYNEPPNNPPNAPSDPDPDHGETGVGVNHDLSWTCSDPDGDSLTYDIYFGTSNPPSLEASGVTETTYDPGTMSYDQYYYWKIVAIDEHDATTTGPVWDFKTKFNGAPNAPSNPDPYNGETGVGVNHDLSWTCSDPNGDSLTYDVYFGDSNPPSQVSWGQSETTYDPGTMSYDTSYYWKIVAIDEHGATKTGSVWYFTTKKANSPPNAPSDPDPENGETSVGINHDLSWTCSDPDGDSLKYHVYFGDSSPPGLVSHSQSETTYDPVTLSFDTKYYWKIKAIDSHGASTDGPIWGFTTRGNSPPDTPETPSGPVKGFTGEKLTYSTVTTDPDGDDVDYLFDLDNGWITQIFGRKSGETVYVDLSWSTPGTYSLTVEATDVYGADSGYSDPLEIKITKAPQEVKWTHIFYMCSTDDEQESRHQKVINRMKNVGSQNNVQFVVLWDGAGEGDTTASYILPGSSDIIPLDEINPNWDNDELNMGDPETLVYFFKYCNRNYPADQYSINIFGHGAAWTGCYLDELPDYMSLEEFSIAFKEIKNKIYGKIDLVMFNSCLMNTIDAAYQLSPYVKFQIGFETFLFMSSEAIDGYEEIFQHMVKKPGITPKELAIYLTDQYFLVDDSTDRASCMSSIALEKMQELVFHVDELAEILIMRLKQQESREQIITAREQSEYISGVGGIERMIDLHDFVHNYLKTLDPDWDINEIILCGKIMELIKGFPDPPIEGAIIKEKHTDSADFCNGISIYFPDKPSRYIEGYEWSGIDFVDDTHWDEFLDKYYTYKRSNEFVGNILLAGISQVQSGLQSQPSSQQQVVPSVLPSQSTKSGNQSL